MRNIVWKRGCTYILRTTIKHVNTNISKSIEIAGTLYGNKIRSTYMGTNWVNNWVQ